MQTISKCSWHEDVKFALKLQWSIPGRSEKISFLLLSKISSTFSVKGNLFLQSWYTNQFYCSIQYAKMNSSNTSFLSLVQFLQGCFQAPVLFSTGRWIRCQWDRFRTFGVCVVYNICQFLIKEIDLPGLSRSAQLDKDVNRSEGAVLGDNV